MAKLARPKIMATGLHNANVLQTVEQQDLNRIRNTIASQSGIGLMDGTINS
jgi:hypothetical protein